MTFGWMTSICLLKEGCIQLNFAFERVAIIWRPILQDIGDVDVFTLEINGREELIQDAPGGPAERTARFRFILARRLANEHDIGVMIALPDHRKIIVVRSIIVKRRLLEIDDCVSDSAELLAAVGRHRFAAFGCVIARSVAQPLGVSEKNPPRAGQKKKRLARFQTHPLWIGAGGIDP